MAKLREAAAAVLASSVVELSSCSAIISYRWNWNLDGFMLVFISDKQG